jgi:hypothetical protein
MDGWMELRSRCVDSRILGHRMQIKIASGDGTVEWCGEQKPYLAVMNEPRAQESQKLLGVAPSKYRPVK